jgi:mannosyltransferase
MSNDAGRIQGLSATLKPSESATTARLSLCARLLAFCDSTPSRSLRPRVAKTLPILLGLAVIVGLAIVLRTIQLNESLWLDELHTAWVVADSPGLVSERAAIGNQASPWFFLVWGVTQVAGLNEIALRLPSVVAGVGLVVLAFHVARCWTGQWIAGLFVALLVALDRNCIFYAQEARPYACVQLVGLAQIFIFSRLVNQPVPLHRIAFVVLTVLLFYLHYTSVLLLAGEVAYYLALHVRQPWRPSYRWHHFLLDLSVALLCMLPASRHIVEIASRRDNWAMFIRRGPLQSVWYLFPLHLYVQVPAQVLVVAYLVCWATKWLKGKRGMRAFGRLAEVWTCDARIAPTRAATGVRPPIATSSLLCVCWLFVPLLLAWSSTYLEFARVFFLRYLIVCALAPILLCGLALAICPSRLFRMILVVVVTWLSVAQSGMIEQYTQDGRVIGDRNQDWRSAMAMINQDTQNPHWPVFIRSGLIEAAELRSSDAPQLRAYCLLPVRGIYRLQRADELLIPLSIHHSGRLSPRQRQRLENSGGGWFLLAGVPSTVSSIESELLSNWDASQYQPRIAGRRVYGNVTVLRLTVDPIPTTRDFQ